MYDIIWLEGEFLGGVYKSRSWKTYMEDGKMLYRIIRRIQILMMEGRKMLVLKAREVEVGNGLI